MTPGKAALEPPALDLAPATPEAVPEAVPTTGPPEPRAGVRMGRVEPGAGDPIAAVCA